MSAIKKKKKHKFSKLLTFILLGVLTLLFGAIVYLNVIPLAWTLIAISITAFIVLGIVLLNFNRTRIWRLLGNLCSIAIIGVTKTKEAPKAKMEIKLTFMIFLSIFIFLIF